MSVTRLEPSFREKVWGSTHLEPWFPDSSLKIGEVWFTPASPHPILVKFLYTTEDLSVQVHPTGPVGIGKTEMWHVLRADEGAQLALGFEQEVTPDEVRAAAQDGSILDLLRWHDVSPGDTFFTPSGTVHAVGAGIALVEIQQNSDITYRLYDYGRPRELHLDQALDVAELGEHLGPSVPVEIQANRQILAACPHFVTEKWIVDSTTQLHADPDRFVICTAGAGSCGSEELRPGVVLLVHGEADLHAHEPLHLLISYRPLPE